MPKCTFCGKVYPVMKGLTLARNSGEVDYYCSSKCRKNAEMGRKPEKLAWVRKGKENKEAKIEIEEGNVEGEVRLEGKEEAKTEEKKE